MTSTIMKCVKIIYFAVGINGNYYKWFKSTREIRQGDPLSSCLFTLFVDVLSSLLIYSQRWETIKGLTIAKNSPTISHVFFADDSLVFCRARFEVEKELHMIFKRY